MDFEALRDAIERREADVLIGFYSEDAELRILNADAPGSPAFELHGKAEIERYLRAVCDQQMSCSVEGEIVFGDESITFAEVCEYPDGTLISVETTLEMREGRIHASSTWCGGRTTKRTGGERVRGWARAATGKQRHDVQTKTKEGSKSDDHADEHEGRMVTSRKTRALVAGRF